MSFRRIVLLLTAVAVTACAGGKVAANKPAARGDFPADFQPTLSSEADEPIGGFGGGGGGVTHTPVIFVHGNTMSANFWLPARKYFLEHGWQPDELWAPALDWNSARPFDSNDLTVPAFERFVSTLQQYLSEKTGRAVRQVDIVAHSLGVTVVRQWMMQNNAFHRVRNFVAVAGTNHGVWIGAYGPNRINTFELAPNSPWLAQLNRNGETPGAVRYMTLYDGSGQADALFPDPIQDSPSLAGAYNLPYNVKHGQRYDRLEISRSKETLREIVAFLSRAREPMPEATPPEIIRTDDQVLRPSQADALVHCESGGKYPTTRSTGAIDWPLEAGKLVTCFAHNPATGLSSPMIRYERTTASTAASELTLTASPRGGAYRNPQSLTLSTNDPDAYIVYTTSKAPPTSGSPLYVAPIYVAGPVTLQALAIAADGRTSALLNQDYNIGVKGN